MAEDREDNPLDPPVLQVQVADVLEDGAETTLELELCANHCCLMIAHRPDTEVDGWSAILGMGPEQVDELISHLHELKFHMRKGEPS